MTQRVEVVRAADAIRSDLPITLRQALEAANRLDRLGLLMPDGATEEWDRDFRPLRRLVTPWEEVTDG